MQNQPGQRNKSMIQNKELEESRSYSSVVQGQTNRGGQVQFPEQVPSLCRVDY